MRCQEEVPSEECRLEVRVDLGIQSHQDGFSCVLHCPTLSSPFYHPSHYAYRNPPLAECPVQMLLSALPCWKLFFSPLGIFLWPLSRLLKMTLFQPIV